MGLRHRLTWLGRHLEFGSVILLLLLAAGIWGFAELADEVVEGETDGFDSMVLLALRNADDLSDPIGPAWLEEMARDFTALGGVGILTLLTLSVAGFLLLRRKHASMWFLLISVGGGILLSSFAKHIFDRPRPDLVPHGSHVYTTSFPSGHSMMAAVTYLTLAVLIARTLPRQRMRAYILALAMLVTLAVGVSRVYLGVHWPTDVLAGWTAGAVWALLCLMVARWLERRQQIDLGGKEPD